VGRLGWRIAPIFFLSVRQFVGGKALWAVAGLSGIPVLFSLIYRIDPSMERPRRYLDGVFTEFMLPSVLPLAVLILATAAFGDELEDRTLPYLVLKPISRFRIVLEKLLAAAVVSAPVVGACVALTWLLIFSDDAGDNTDMLWGMLAAVGAGTLVYTAVFQFLTLFIQRAILASIIYSLVWETVLGRFVPGLRYASIRHLVRSIYTAVIDDRRIGLTGAFGLEGALTGVAVVTVIALIVSTLRLRALNIE
jgi:ABC-2 type transport system permease protein